MPQELGLPKYYKLSETDPGTKLVEKGEYIGEVMGKYGAQHRFRQMDDGQEVVLSGGSLNWRVKQEHIALGDVFDIYFEGKGIVEKGDFAGKESNNYKLEKYSLEELKLLGFKKTAGAPESSAPVGNEPAQPLDDLE